MALRDAVFAEGIGLFEAGRLAYGFTTPTGYQFDPIVVREWILSPSKASGAVEWIAPAVTSLTGFNLLDRGALVEFIAFRDSDGHPDVVRVLRGMVLGYTHEVMLVDG